ncbi:hypothetical protein [Bacillus sp. B1-b2]|uniref:hypothetical protein n=1 Tax=Bacillus sp. B1-b2 TaxID=2653201 RepID=UPI00126236A4|nr:hypothetical protein [Bacillus sp. B1-b2]KAB7672009.1 hypothetical protein F9279_03545 [Bacillus sp. B1-b2]
MNVNYYYYNQLLLSTVTNDLNGLITAIEKSESLQFQEKICKLDRFLLNHYKVDGVWEEEFIVYLKDYDDEK